MGIVQRIDNGTYFTPSDGDIRNLYDYPSELAQPWIRVNFVSSIDGAVTVDGKSGGLGTPIDKRVFDALRSVTDAVVVGSGTASAENYGGVVLSDEVQNWRTSKGLAAVPPVVVVTSSAGVDPDGKLVTEADTPPIVVTTDKAPADKVDALRAAGARVVICAGDTVTSDALRSTLADLSLLRVLCEGGPGLFGQLIDDDAVDEVCITTSPTLASGDAGRIAHSSNGVARAMRTGHVLADDDGTLQIGRAHV